MLHKLVSKYSVYAVVFSSLYLLQKFVFIDIMGIHRILICHRVYAHEIVFVVTSLLITKICFRVELNPDQNLS